MDKDKAIRAAKLTLGGMLEKKRHTTAVSRADGQVSPSKYLPDVPRAVHADGGRVGYGNGGKSLGLHSKAAQVIRNQPQAKGSVDQLLAMVSKTKGVKPAELSNAGRPAGKTMSKEELAQHFEQALPDVQVMRKGREVQTALNALMQQDRRNWTQEDWDKANALHFEAQKQPSTRYDQYTLSGGENYREHLLHLPRQDGPIAKRLKALQGQWQEAYENQAPREDLDRMGAKIDALSEDAENEDVNFKSDHWQTPNVLAHVRMSDRDNGKTLHVHEVQSDWGQAGREQGFHDPENPYEVINKKTREVVSKHPDFSSMWDAYRTNPNSDSLDYGDYSTEKPPQGPYVGNTQQWTDLALKHVLMEAAKGGHDRVVFSPGEANADMYGQRKEMGMLKFLKSKDSGEAGVIVGYSKDGRRLSPHKVDSHAEVEKLIGKENATNLLAQPQMPAPEKSDDSYIDTLQGPLQQGDSRYAHTLQGPLQVGGHGMVDYYKNFVHQGALKLLQQHDPSIKPESYDLPNDYKGFALPMTDTARESILKNGFQAFQRGGEVHKADGGEVEKKRDFMRDNPGGEWLEGKRARAAQYPGDKFMIGATTGVIGGRSSMFLPTHVLKGIAGLNDEVRTTGVSKYDSLLSDAQKGGFDPEQKGNKVVVAVNHFGQPYLLEGNTRVAVAHSMGIPKVRAEVRYWNGAENVDGPMHPENVFSMASDSPDVAKADGGEVDGDEDGITAYHSSPHDFDNFDIAHMGTGEGNQAYGHGLYFAENPKVSDRGGQYWNQFMNRGKQTPERQAAFALKVAGWDRDKAALGLQKNLEYHADRAIPGKYADGPEIEEGNRLLAQETQEAINHIRSGKILGPRTYKVRLNVQPHELIDWDKPLSEQHPNVRAVLGEGNELAGVKLRRASNPLFAGDIVRKDRASPKELSEHLLSKGIKGIRYKDAGSRSDDSDNDQTYNYVMFHHDPVKVLEKYEYGGTVAKATGGPVMGYVPMASLTAPKLAIARAPQYQQQAPVARFSESLNSLMDTVEGFKKKPELKDVQNKVDPSSARNTLTTTSGQNAGYDPSGMSEAANAAYAKLVDAYGQPLNVISTYRDPQKNQDVGGAKGSQHLHGNAYDIDVSNMSYEDRLALADLAWNSGFRGIGFYDNSLHFDVGDPRSWGPSHSRDSIPEWAQPFTQERYGYSDGGIAMDDNSQDTSGGNNVESLSLARSLRNIGSGGGDDRVQGLFEKIAAGQQQAQKAYEMAHSNGEFDDFKIGDTFVYKHSKYPTPMKVTGFSVSRAEAFPQRKRIYNNHVPVLEMENQDAEKKVNKYPVEWFQENLHKYDFVSGKPRAVKAGGGAMDDSGQNGAMENGNAPINFETRPQAGGLLNAGGVRGSAGVLQAQDEAPLEGLPTKIGIPLSGQSVTAGPDPRIRQVARDYMASTGMKYNPPTKYAKVDPIRARRIAAAYEGMKDDPNDPLTKASYDAMIKETMAQYNHAKKAGLKVEFWNPEKQEDPYGASPRLATEDVRKNHHMWVFPTYAGYGSGDPISEDDAKKNPLLQLTGETWNGIPVTVNDVFRAVHDYYGHAKEGVGFRADGEENAWRSHASMYSPLARMAMTSETRGQNSWLNYGPHGEKNRNARTEDTIFAPQKIGVMPHWAHHEGAEDFTLPEDVEAMQRIRSNFDPTVSKALALTRRFTKGGESAINALKSKGK